METSAPHRYFDNKIQESFSLRIITRFLDFLEKTELKKNHFLVIALALSILLHALAFVFAPELKSEINPSDYLKKITRISIFRDDSSSAPESRNVEKKSSAPENRNIEKKRAPKPRNLEISKSRNIDENNSAQDRNLEISKSRNIDENNSAQDRNLEISKPRNIDDKNSAQDRNIEISESRNIDDKNSAPKTAGELAVIPKAKNPKTPPYPESLEDEGIEGSVTLELLISKEGKVLKAKVIKSDHELFSESALQTVKNYRFSPGKLKDGSVVDSLIEFVIKFEISL